MKKVIHTSTAAIYDQWKNRKYEGEKMHMAAIGLRREDVDVGLMPLALEGYAKPKLAPCHVSMQSVHTRTAGIEQTENWNRVVVIQGQEKEKPKYFGEHYGEFKIIGSLFRIRHSKVCKDIKDDSTEMRLDLVRGPAA